MLGKCPHCGKPPYPIKDENGKWIYKNLFRIDWYILVIVILLLFSAWAYRHDTLECRKVLERPCDYIQQFDCKEVDRSEGINSPHIYNPEVN